MRLVELSAHVAAAAAIVLPLWLMGCGSEISGDGTPSLGYFASSGKQGQTVDFVASLPTYGIPKTPHYAGFVDVTPDGNNQLFYYFVTSQNVNKWAKQDIPLLVWLNGGPGASSLTGLLAENLGPQKITAEGTLVDNPDTITKKYHLIVVDNPVGAGYSRTSTGAYVRNEFEVRTQFVAGLKAFFKVHPEFQHNPLWVTGESYGGKYVPNIAMEIAVNSTKDIPNFKGIIVGNGLYNETAQFSSIGDFAFGAGVIDDQLLGQVKERENICLQHITSPSMKKTAGPFCENTTSKWLYSADVAGELFYYDIGLLDATFFDTITNAMGKYLNRDDVRQALHVGSQQWVQHDASGPVSDNLAADWVVSSILQVAKLLNIGKYRVVLYNGVRDGSVCNHIGNLRALLSMSWDHAPEFQTAENTPWPSKTNVQGHIRSTSGLSFATVLRTGHLVPTVVPQSFATLLAMIVEADVKTTLI